VLLILAGIWAAVILVPLVRAKTEGSLGDSIGSFRRHLSILERTAPSVVPPANRLRAPRAGVSPNAQRQMAASRVLVESGYPRARRRRPVGPGMAAARRRQSQRRRRDVLLALLAGMGGSFLLGMVNGLRIMLLVNVCIDLMFVGYVMLLIRLRNMAAEREVKLMFLPPTRSRGPAPARTGRPARPARGAGYARSHRADDEYYEGYYDGPEYSDVPAMLMRRAN
jgi:hypothetical protein